MYKIQHYIYLRTDKIDKSGNAPIYFRISENGFRAEIYLKVKINPSDWDSVRQRAINKKNIVNTRIEDAISRINSIERKYIDSEIKPTIEQIKLDFLGIQPKKHLFINEWNKLIDEIEKSINSNYSKGTLFKYRTTRDHFAKFLERHTGKSEIEFNQITIDLINSFSIYLRADLGFKNNTAVKYLKNTKIVFNRGLKRGWITYDPFIELDMSYERVERTCLLKYELELLINKQFEINRIQRVKDYFVFCCFTGLSFSDLKKLCKKNIIDFESQLMIEISRTKTGNTSLIPLLKEAERILIKYGYAEKQSDEPIFDIPSNQKYNSYLKEISDACGIRKNLTSHVARHTFATTVTLDNQVSLEAVSKMLGHSQIRTTQIYSRVTKEKLLKEMSQVRVSIY